MSFTFEQKVYLLKHAEKLDQESKNESPAFAGSKIHDEAKRVEASKVVKFDDSKQGKQSASMPNPLVDKASKK